jgi:hypothetical protein
VLRRIKNLFAVVAAIIEVVEMTGVQMHTRKKGGS